MMCAAKMAALPVIAAKMAAFPVNAAKMAASHVGGSRCCATADSVATSCDPLTVGRAHTLARPSGCLRQCSLRGFASSVHVLGEPHGRGGVPSPPAARLEPVGGMWYHIAV